MSIRFSLRAPSGQETAITGPFRIGRDPECQIRIDNNLVSRIHASIWLDQDHLLLRDERSRNGTQLNGRPLVPGEAHYLHHADLVTIGDTVLTVVSDPPYPRPGQHGGLPEQPGDEPPPTANLEKEAVQAVVAAAAAPAAPAAASAGAPAAAVSGANASASAGAKRSRVVPLVIGGCLLLALLALCAGLGFAAVVVERQAISTALAPHPRPSATPGAASALFSSRAARRPTPSVASLPRAACAFGARLDFSNGERLSGGCLTMKEAPPL
jgi:pSer/pThr/pTyr-binding forkhead associated (FHA) protein